MKLTFFNHYHNGDCFVGKGWVKNIIDQLPEVEFIYAHGNHPDIIKDLPVKFINISELPSISHMTRIASDNDNNLYLNTWCGCFQGDLFPFGQHSNYIVQHKMYQYYCEKLSEIFHKSIIQYDDPREYLPIIGYKNLGIINSKIDNILWRRGSRLILFCNGPVLSGQSNVGDFSEVIKNLSINNPSWNIICTQSIDYKADNIFNTSDIFGLESDLNLIGYYSQFCDIVVGKNSGPFTFCMNSDNLMKNSRTQFYCFGKLLTDCLDAGLRLLAKRKFSSVTDDSKIIEILQEEMLYFSSYRGLEFIQ